MNNDIIPTIEGLAAARRLRARRLGESSSLTAAQRVSRAGEILTGLEGRLMQRLGPKALQTEAEKHEDAALRLIDRARTENETRLQMVLIEMAGHRALEAQVLRARARERVS
jgi:hypothetical protein